MPLRINYDQKKLADIARRWGVRRLWAFGSVLRDDFHAKSDVDLLYEFEEGRTPGWEILDLENELSALFEGRPVDFGAWDGVSPIIRDRVQREAVQLFGERMTTPRLSEAR